jgi:4-amino-4-deoxy-L-arabinose transferase-like glycosyltransferase
MESLAAIQVPKAARALFSYPSFLWSQVLFPGPQNPHRQLRWISLLILVLVSGALLYPCLSFYLFEPDEGRYAEIPREMLARGEWLVPYLQGEPYLDKPPLMYWLVMVSYRIFGQHDWSARLIPALAIQGCVLISYLIGRRSLGERAAFWGALGLSLAPGFVSVGRLLILDGLLAFSVTLSIFAAFEAIRGERFHWRWWLLAALACGLGVLTKGPIAIILLVPPIWAYRLLTCSSCAIGRRWWTVFAVVVLLVVSPWYVAMSLRIPGFVRYFFWEQNVVRFLSPFDHQRPIWFYAPVLLAGLLPASLLVLPLVRFLLSGDERVAQGRSKELGFMLLAGGWCVVFFTASGCKLPTYILPAFPFFALSLGAYFVQSRWPWRQVSNLPVKGQVENLPPRVLSRWTSAMIGVSFALLAVGHYLVVPWYARFHSPMLHAAEVERLCRDPRTPVVCYPRNCDSVAFYLGRDDLRSYRSKETHLLVGHLQRNPRTVVLFSHRHSLKGLEQALESMSPDLHLTHVTPLGGSWIKGLQAEFCYMAVVESVKDRGSWDEE